MPGTISCQIQNAKPKTHDSCRSDRYDVYDTVACSFDNKVDPDPKEKATSVYWYRRRRVRPRRLSLLEQNNMAKKSKGLQIPSVDVAKLKAVLSKAVQYNTKPTEETFPELPDVLVWLRFMLAVVYGSFLGIRNVRSATMLLHNLNLLGTWLIWIMILLNRLHSLRSSHVLPFISRS